MPKTWPRSRDLRLSEAGWMDMHVLATSLLRGQCSRAHAPDKEYWNWSYNEDRQTHWETI
jgi:hypothetical protein